MINEESCVEYDESFLNNELTTGIDDPQVQVRKWIARIAERGRRSCQSAASLAVTYLHYRLSREARLAC